MTDHVAHEHPALQWQTHYLDAVLNEEEDDEWDRMATEAERLAELEKPKESLNATSPIVQGQKHSLGSVDDQDEPAQKVQKLEDPVDRVAEIFGQLRREKGNVDETKEQELRRRDRLKSHRIPRFAVRLLKLVQQFSVEDLHELFDYVRSLGQGGYASVHLVRNRHNGEEYALKIIDKRRLMEDRKDFEHTVREVGISHAMDHPNLLHVWECFETYDSVILQMDFCGGGDLHTRILEMPYYTSSDLTKVEGSCEQGKGAGAFTEYSAKQVFRALLSALSYLHARGITHRDLKLENILVSQSDEDIKAGREPDWNKIKVADMGMAALREKGTSGMMYQRCGTLMYAAPEVIYGKPYTNKVDSWGAGVILHLLLTGTYPFYHENPEIVMRRIVTCDAPWRNDMWLKVSPEAKDLCKRLLQVRPAARPSADEALQHAWLKEINDTLGDGSARELTSLDREIVQEIGSSREEFGEIIREGTPGMSTLDRSSMMDNLARQTPLQARFKQEFMSRYTEEYFEKLAATAKALTEALFDEQVDKAVNLTVTPPPEGVANHAELQRSSTDPTPAPKPTAGHEHLASDLEKQVASDTSESTLPEQVVTDRISQMSLSRLPTLQTQSSLGSRSPSPRRQKPVVPRLSAETQARLDKMVVSLTPEPPKDLQQLLKEDKGVKLADLRPMD